MLVHSSDTIAYMKWYTSLTSPCMKYLAPIIVMLVMLIAVFVVYAHYQSEDVLFIKNPVQASADYDAVLTIMLVTGLLLAVIVPTALYLLTHVQVVARRIAFTLTKDIASSHDRLRRFYELSPVPYLIVDKQGVIKRPNKASLRFLGVNEEQIVGQQLFDYFSLPEHAERLERYKEEVKRSIAIELKELQVRTASGELRWALFSAENLDTEQVLDSQLLVTLVDIHEQKELERIKTEFLSLASHQLRAPLANLKWYIDFLLKRRTDGMDPEVVDYLKKMYRRNEEMIDLVNTLLNLSRVEMGRVKVQMEQTDLVGLSHSVVEELETVAQEKQITITAHLPEALQFNTDGRLLRIVFQNLLTNALRYTNAGGVVELRVRGDEHSVLFEVADSGVGIPPEEQGRIFSKMYRATNAQAMEVNGNGIGLYMCKALVEALGGTIDFTSTLGKGTVFSVVLRT